MGLISTQSCSSMARRGLLLALLIAMVHLAACKGKDVTKLHIGVKVRAVLALEPPDQHQADTSALQHKPAKCSAKAKAGDSVSVHYTVSALLQAPSAHRQSLTATYEQGSLTDGTVFDSSLDRGTVCSGGCSLCLSTPGAQDCVRTGDPITFTLGQGQGERAARRLPAPSGSRQDTELCPLWLAVIKGWDQGISGMW